MILNRLRRSQLVVCAVVVIALLALGAAIANGERQAVGSSERLRQLMTERYEILQNIAASVEKLFEAGMVSLREWQDARVTLYQAQADVAADRAERIRVYEEMVEFLRKAEQLAQRRADSGRMTQLEVQQARLATIEAQMALEKLRLGQTQ